MKQIQKMKETQVLWLCKTKLKEYSYRKWLGGKNEEEGYAIVNAS